MTSSQSPTRAAGTARRAALFLATALSLTVPLASTALAATDRCSIEAQRNVCMDANPVCPATSGPLGLAAGTWPVFQGNVQHTGVSPLRGPTCGNRIWSRKLKGGLLAAPVLAPGRTGEPETLFVPQGKEPLCALNPVDGSIYWCGTDKLGKLADRSSPVVGNGSFAYVGTRDNDLWAINVPPLGSTNATVAWQQFVCTDGDITAPPIIGTDGVVFMGSDSLGAGTLMAMCPGPTRQPKWCINPLGGGIRNASPALSPAGDELYVLFGGGGLVALDPETGAEHWRILVEPLRSVGRTPNHAPVVNPRSGRIYVGMTEGLWAVDPPSSPGAAPVATLLLDVRGTGLRIDTPPALDLDHGNIVLGVWKPHHARLYGLSLTGGVQWQRDDLGTGRFRDNNPPVVDARGRIYLTLDKSLIALNRDGTDLWRSEFLHTFESSPILADGRLYVGGSDGTVYAVGDCPSS